MASSDAIDLLRSIDASLKQLLRVMAVQQPKEIADARDLDSKYGDPVVHFSPRDWTGPSFKGRFMSECPPEFLDVLAETLDYFARKAEETNEEYKGKPVAPYKRKDAARARGWAKRKREGWQGTREPAGVAAGGSGDDFGESEWPEGDDL